MKHLVCLLLTLAPAVASADRVYNAVGGGSHDCNKARGGAESEKDSGVILNIASGKFTVTGACEKVTINGASNTIAIESAKKVTVNGMGNTVDLGAAEKIAINGSDNSVNWKKGLGADKPKVSQSGTGNKINQVK